MVSQAPTQSSPTVEEFRRLRRVVAYQFGAGAEEGLFPDHTELTVRRTSSGRIEQVFAGETRLVSRRTDGRMTISIAAARRLATTFPDRYRVTVGAESAPYIRDGKNAFAKFVQAVDPAIRPGDEVWISHDATVIGVGRAELAAAEMQAFNSGMAVKVRYGAGPAE